jgi:hypothetical protein
MKQAVAETAPQPTNSADSSASVAHSAGTSGECGPYRKKRNDFEEQAELVDVLNMLSQMYRDQVCEQLQVIVICPVSLTSHNPVL